MSAIDAITLTIPMQMAAGFLGSMAFAIIFGVPRKFYLHSGFVGMIGWIIYVLLVRYTGMSSPFASFFATVGLALTSRALAVWAQCPVTVFLISGIIPLVPGGGIYWTMYYLVTGKLHEAATTGVTAVMVMVAIAFAIALVKGLPAKMFAWVHCKAKAE